MSHFLELDREWLNCARILGMGNAATPIFNSTFFIMTESYPSAATAGIRSPKKTLSGEAKMHKIDLNMARSHVGHKVNLHLKDGSVIVNVVITNAGKNTNGFETNRSILHFVAQTNGKTKRIPLTEIEWIDPLSNFILS